METPANYPVYNGSDKGETAITLDARGAFGPDPRPFKGWYWNGNRWLFVASAEYRTKLERLLADIEAQ